MSQHMPGLAMRVRMEKAAASALVLALQVHCSGRGVSQNCRSSTAVHLNSGPYSDTHLGQAVVCCTLPHFSSRPRTQSRVGLGGAGGAGPGGGGGGGGKGLHLKAGGVKTSGSSMPSTPLKKDRISE